MKEHCLNPHTRSSHLSKIGGRVAVRPAWGRRRNSGMQRILIIEDDRVDREIYKHCLKHSTGLQFDFAESGSAAGGIELSRSWAPDCILLDFNLPDMDGLEVL